MFDLYIFLFYLEGEVMKKLYSFISVFILLSAINSYAQTVDITTPVNKGDVKCTGNGACFFDIEGNSTEITNNSDLGIFAVVHPIKPSAGWFIQFPESRIDGNGNWSTSAGIGNDEFPPHHGNTLEIVAIIANKDCINKTTPGEGWKTLKSIPCDIVAQSDIVKLKVKITSFTFKCNNKLNIGAKGIETLFLELGNIETCKLKLTNLETGTPIEIGTNLQTGFGSSIIVEPAKGIVDNNGELEITITAVKKGIDWIAWAVPNDKGLFKFNKRSYDSGNAWGMFVEVK